MLAVFGYFAIKALPDIEDAVLDGDESHASEEASEVVNISVSPEQSGGEETSEPDKKEEFDSLSCVFATRNSAGDLCSLIYIGISEEKRTYVICRIPVDITIDVDGVPKKFQQLRCQTPEHLCRQDKAGTKHRCLFGFQLQYQPFWNQPL